MVFVNSLLLGLPTACSAFYLAVQKLASSAEACLLAYLLGCCLAAFMACLLAFCLVCLYSEWLQPWLGEKLTGKRLVGWLVACLSACLLNSHCYSLDWGIRSQQAM